MSGTLIGNAVSINIFPGPLGIIFQNLFPQKKLPHGISELTCMYCLLFKARDHLGMQVFVATCLKDMPKIKNK